jgi:hypothetical protein
MADVKSNQITIGASDFFQYDISGYGKNASSDTITIDADMEGATITALGGTKKINAGDMFYVYPFLTTDSAPVAASSNTLILNVTRFVSQVGFENEDITITFATESTASAIAGVINTQFVTDGYDSDLVATVVDTDKVRIQALKMNVQFKFTGGTYLTDSKFPSDERGKYAFVKATKNIDEVDTDIEVQAYYNTKTALTDGDRTDLEYEVIRFLGESTSSRLVASLNPNMYKGNKPLAVQIEYDEGTSQYEINSLVFNYENLSYLKGWEEKTTGAFMSGKTASNVRTFEFTGKSKPNRFSMLALHRKADGVGLMQITCPKCLCPATTISIEKAFRTEDLVAELMKNTDKAVALITSI